MCAGRLNITDHGKHIALLTEGATVHYLVL